MADYPTTIYEHRDMENWPAVLYDPTKKTMIYAEDFLKLAAEVTSIETVLGENVNGAYATVLAWLQDLAEGGGGVPAVLQSSLKPADDISIAADFCSVAVGVFEVASGKVLSIASGGVLAVL